MDFIRTTDHIQSRPGFADHNTAPHDSNKPFTNLSEFKGSALPRGRANAGHATGQYDQYAPNKAQATDTPPPSLIARMTRGVLANQRRQLESLPSGSRDTRMALHYKASYVLQDRGGATAPGAELSLRPTGKAAGGMDNLSTYTRGELRTFQELRREEIREAENEYQRQMNNYNNATSSSSRRAYYNSAQTQLSVKRNAQRDLDAITWELEARSGRSGGHSSY